MSEEKNRTVVYQSSGSSLTGKVLTLASIGAGAVHGFYDAKGTPLPQEYLEAALTYGPALVRGSISGTVAGLTGLGIGGLIGGATGVETSSYKSSNLEKIAKGGAGATAGGAFGAVALGAPAFVVGAAKGGFQTLIGYGIGYVIGSLVN